ncbi:acyl-CoA dehydrogenase family protein [Streptomyces sp. NPDC020792]|uniref:acyl-CoA dehydrogenase family protein n=1 Tax=Streptomyces sp. NPDC020792 TaxID=3365089 RepID=UPI0037A2A1D5
MAGYALRRLDPSLDENQDVVRDAFADFFTNESPSSVVRDAEPLGHDAALWRKLAGMGVASMSLPESAGGDNATLVDLVLVAEEWGRTLAPVPLASQVVATRLLAATGAPGAVVSAAAEGDRLVTLAHHPAYAGAAQLVPDAAVAADVIALVGDELVLFSASAPGKHVPNQGSTPLAWWQPDDAVTRTVLATGAEATTAHATAVGEWKLLTSAALVGMTEAALRIGVEFAKTRETMGVPIGTLQGVSFPLADVAIAVAGTRNFVYQAAWLADHEPGSRPELPLMVFDAARRMATHGTTTAAHVQGGLGFTTEADSSLYFLRAKGWSALVGDTGADLRVIGDRLLSARRG